jgi:hypothetical protein
MSYSPYLRCNTLFRCALNKVARWPVTACTTNFPMSLDESHHRLFVGCRMPARRAVFDTESGKIVVSPAMVEHTDDLLYDAGKGGSMF